MEKQELLRYLKQVAALETDIDTLSSIEANLKTKPLPQYNPVTRPAMDYKQRAESRAAYDAEKKSHFWWGVLGAVVAFAIACALFWIPLLGILLFIGSIPIGADLGSEFGEKQDRKKLTVRYEQEEKMKDEEAYKRYKVESEQYEHNYQSQKQSVQAFNLSIVDEKQTICKTKRIAEDALNNLYARNIIHPKYRGIVPVHMFCEYIEAGNCDRLEGAAGCYNKYDDELRAYIIISQLSSIKEVLGKISIQIGNVIYKQDQILRNQYMLCQSIQQSNQLIGSISCQAEEIAAQNRSLQASTTWTAYNTAVLARCVDADPTTRDTYYHAERTARHVNTHLRDYRDQQA